MIGIQRDQVHCGVELTQETEHLNTAAPRVFDVRKEEAFVIGKFISGLEFEECINFGSGDIEQLLRRKPWIEAEIFTPLRTKGVRIIHSDLQHFNGVDICIDLTDQSAVKNLMATATTKCVLLCNVLEHIPSQLRPTIVANVEQALATNDYLVISVPHKYPYHPDPIDTMYRPHIDDLEAQLETRCIMKTEVASETYWQEISQMPIFKACRKLLKPLWLLQKPNRYRESFSRLSFLFRRYRISVIATVKQ